MFPGLDGGGAQCNALRLQGHLGETEVKNLYLISIRDEDVSGFDVSVNDSLRAASIASAIWIPRSSTVSIASGLPPIMCRRVCPSNNSIAIKVFPSESSISWIVQMFGWFSED